MFARIRKKSDKRAAYLASLRRPPPFDEARVRRLQARPQAVYDAGVWVPLCDGHVERAWVIRGRPAVEHVVCKPVPHSRSLGRNKAAERTLAWSEQALEATIVCLHVIGVDVSENAQVQQMYRVFYATRSPVLWHAFYSALITDVNRLMKASAAESKNRLRRPRSLGDLHDAIMCYRNQASGCAHYSLETLQQCMLGVLSVLTTRPLVFMVMNAIHRGLGAAPRVSVSRPLADDTKRADEWEGGDEGSAENVSVEAEDDQAGDISLKQARLEVELFGEDSDIDEDSDEETEVAFDD